MNHDHDKAFRSSCYKELGNAKTHTGMMENGTHPIRAGTPATIMPRALMWRPSYGEWPPKSNVMEKASFGYSTLGKQCKAQPVRENYLYRTNRGLCTGQSVDAAP
jgi:hypothetical protein